MISDQGTRSVIPLRVVSGGLTLLGGAPLPKLRDGAVCELALAESAIEDRAFLEKLHREEVRSFLPARRILLVEVYSQRGDDRLIPPSEFSVTSLMGNGFVEAVLLEDLAITVRATKRATLRPCQMHIPALDREVGSVNQAYSRISEEFERHRQSHTGNVFQKVYSLEIDGARRPNVRRLEELRRAEEASFATEVFGFEDEALATPALDEERLNPKEPGSPSGHLRGSCP